MVECQAPPDDGGSIPTPSLHFSPCRLADVSDFVKKNHYSHSYPGGIDLSFRLDFNGQLGGACLFGYKTGNVKATFLRSCSDVSKYRELVRLVLLDEVPKNSESRFIGWCLRWLRKNTDLVGIVSFADPREGHRGTVYRATNWIYCGLQKPDRDRIFIDGTEIHPRSCVGRYGTSSIKRLIEMGLNVTTAKREPKHRYVQIFQGSVADLKWETRKWDWIEEI